MNFFDYHVDKEFACGHFSFAHICFIIVCLALIVVCIYLSIKHVKNMNKFLLIIGIVTLMFEIAKIIWGTIVGRYELFV